MRRWECAVCGETVYSELLEGSLQETPASRYWTENMLQVFCSPEHSLLFHDTSQLSFAQS